MSHVARKSEARDRASAGEKRAEREVLLCCARTRTEAESADQIRGLLREDLDWAYLIRTAHWHGLIPLLYYNLHTVCPEGVPRPVLLRLRKDFHALGLRTHFLLEELLELLHLFDEQEVAVIPFKGPSLAAYAYGTPALRSPGDLDILIHRRHFTMVRDLLIERGYRPRIKLAKEVNYLRRRGGSTFVHEEYEVDLHWTLEQKPFDSFPCSWRLDPEQAWERSTTVCLAGRTVRSLTTEDLLSYLCVHGAKDAWQCLYMICDVAELIREHPNIDWQQMVQQACEAHSERILRLGLFLAAELLGADLPEGVQQYVRGDARVRALALQVSTWLFKPSKQEGFGHHLFRTRMLQRPHKKILYLLYRGMRKLSKSQIITTWRSSTYS